MDFAAARDGHTAALAGALATALRRVGTCRVFAAVYQRARGMDHPHATRVLARAWIRVIYRCWLNHEPYDPARQDAARGFSAQPNLAQAV